MNKIFRKMRSFSLQLGINSFNQFKHKLKQFDASTLEGNSEKLRPYYEYYINEVSREDMAASLELATLMYTLCKLNKYKKLLDMGSGLSSFVFRFYAKGDPDVRVFSVDDDVTWLEKTRSFLELHHLDTRNILTLDEFLESSENDFDCILHDLNFVETRIHYVEQVMKVAKKNGVIIFDDVHKPDYLFALLTKLKDINAAAFDLRPVTRDRFDRFALAVVNG